MIPRAATERGVGYVEFSVRAPGEKDAFVAGRFNNWGDAVNGAVQNEDARMEGPDSRGFFRKTIKLDPGIHHFQYVIGAENSSWIHVSADKMPVDESGNNVLVIDDQGRVPPEGAPYVYPPRATTYGVEFRVYAPGYRSAFLAGDFNNWANIKDGRITDTRFMMFVAGNNEFIRTEHLKEGVYEYGINLDSRSDRWLSGSPALPMGDNGYRQFTVTEAGTVAECLSQTLLPPRMLPSGEVEFIVFAPDHHEAWLAGSFNDWGPNAGGQITNPEAKMTRDANGIFRKSLKLEPGTYSFKYVVGNGGGNWHPVVILNMPRDGDGNTVFTVSRDGAVNELRGIDPMEASGLTTYLRAQDNFLRMQGSVRAVASGPPQAPTSKPRLMLFYHPKTAPSQEALTWLESSAGRNFLQQVSIERTDVTTNPEVAQKYGVFRVPAAILLNDTGDAVERAVFTGNTEDFLEQMRALSTSAVREQSARAAVQQAPRYYTNRNY